MIPRITKEDKPELFQGSLKELKTETQQLSKTCTICLKQVKEISHSPNWPMIHLDSMMWPELRPDLWENTWLKSQFSNTKTITSLMTKSKGTSNTWITTPTEIRFAWWKSSKTSLLTKTIPKIICSSKRESTTHNFLSSETWFWIWLISKTELDLYLRTLVCLSTPEDSRETAPRKSEKARLNSNKCLRTFKVQEASQSKTKATQAERFLSQDQTEKSQYLKLKVTSKWNLKFFIHQMMKRKSDKSQKSLLI